MSSKDARISFVYNSKDDALEKLEIALSLTKDETKTYLSHPKGVFFSTKEIDKKLKIAGLFSGQGSQYLTMGNELCFNYPSAMESYSLVDEIRLSKGLKALSGVVFPSSTYTEDKNEKLATLTKTENAQPALAAMSSASYKIMKESGLSIDMAVGHSFDTTALWAAGAIDEKTL